jgi:hypothetical protein
VRYSHIAKKEKRPFDTGPSDNVTPVLYVWAIGFFNLTTFKGKLIHSLFKTDAR